MRKHLISCDWCNQEYEDTEADGDEEEYWRRFYNDGWLTVQDEPDATKEFCGVECLTTTYARED